MDYRDPSFLRPATQIRRGRATRPSGNREVIDPQPVHEYQAEHPPVVAWEMPLGWRMRVVLRRHRVTILAAGILIASFLAAFARDWFLALEDGGAVRTACIAGFGYISGFVCRHAISMVLR